MPTQNGTPNAANHIVHLNRHHNKLLHQTVWSDLLRCLLRHQSISHPGSPPPQSTPHLQPAQCCVLQMAHPPRSQTSGKRYGVFCHSIVHTRGVRQHPHRSSNICTISNPKRSTPTSTPHPHTHTRTQDQRVVLALMTHFADLSSFEFAQKLLPMLPTLSSAGVVFVAVGLGDVANARKFADMLSFPVETLYAGMGGEMGRLCTAWVGAPQHVPTCLLHHHRSHTQPLPSTFPQSGLCPRHQHLSLPQTPHHVGRGGFTRHHT